MTEVPSQSQWVGRIITCKTCNRSYRVEAGDEIKGGFSSHKRGSMPTRFDLPCSHYWAIPKVDEKPINAS